LGMSLFILSCNFIGRALNLNPTPTPTEIVFSTDCPDPQPTQQHIDRALQYNAEHFNTSNWKRDHYVIEYRVSVTWRDDDLGAITNFDHVIFCSVTNTTLDHYYTDDTFNVIFQNYEEHSFQRECRSNDLRFYEFNVKSEGSDYNSRFWVEIVDTNHIIESLLVFPAANSTDLDFYSEQIMPELPSCK
jgi:hypothetical protein